MPNERNKHPQRAGCRRSKVWLRFDNFVLRILRLRLGQIAWSVADIWKMRGLVFGVAVRVERLGKDTAEHCKLDLEAVSIYCLKGG